MHDFILSSRVVIAANNAPTGIEILVCGGLLLFAVIAALAAEYPKVNVVTKNGLPHCPFCGRQVSLRRNWCRACGADLTVRETEKPSIWVEPNSAWIEKEKAEQTKRIRDAQIKTRINQKIREAKQQKADEYWIARGVEPGPMAWWRALPDWVRVTTITVAVAVPLALALLKRFD